MKIYFLLLLFTLSLREATGWFGRKWKSHVNCVESENESADKREKFEDFLLEKRKNEIRQGK